MSASNNDEARDRRRALLNLAREKIEMLLAERDGLTLRIIEARREYIALGRRLRGEAQIAHGNALLARASARSED